VWLVPGAGLEPALGPLRQIRRQLQLGAPPPSAGANPADGHPGAQSGETV